jgi:serine/threonine protein kinase
MTNTDLGACEPFIYELRRSNLVERGQLDQLLEDFLRRNPRAEPGILAEHLVSQNVLTKFQADRVAQGKTQGLVLGPYVLCDSVGAGSMGSVHRAMSKNDNKAYAVKVLPRRSMWNVRLARRQVRTFSQFSHASVVPFVDVGTSGGLHYLVWNFVEGETLESLVQRRSKLDATTTAYIGLHLAAGLGQAHQHGLFHGLIKPSNAMIGAGGQVSLLDFGIGSLLAENEGESLVDTMSTANTLTSGLDCSSPESIMEPTNRTPAGDQYALGCVLYYCLTGRYPFPEGSAVEKMMAHQFKQPISVKELAPETPDELVKVIEKLMQKKPEDRFQTVDEAHEALVPLSPPEAPLLLAGTGSQALTQTPFGGSLTTKTGLSANGLRTPSASHVPARSASFESLRLPSMPAMTGSPPPAPMSPPPAGAAPMQPSRSSMRSQVSPRASLNQAMMNARASMSGLPPVSPRTSMANPAAMNPRAAANPRGATTASMVNLQLPMPGEVYQLDQAPPAQAPQQVMPDNGEPKPSMGPLGFIAVGAAVAVAVFLVVHNLIK